MMSPKKIILIIVSIVKRAVELAEFWKAKVYGAYTHVTRIRLYQILNRQSILQSDQDIPKTFELVVWKYYEFLWVYKIKASSFYLGVNKSTVSRLSIKVFVSSIFSFSNS